MSACRHTDNHFDRSLCACGAMHFYCNDCGEVLDDCPYDRILAGYDRKHKADIDAYHALLEARILELEHQLAQPKHQRWQAPINRENT